MMRFETLLALALLLLSHVHAFSVERPSSRPHGLCKAPTTTTLLSSSVTASDGDRNPSAASTGASINGSGATDAPITSMKQLHGQLLRAQAGAFAFKTKYGVLNPFALWYGFVSIGLGLFWFVGLTMYQFFAFVTRGKVDKNRLIPNLLNQTWGTLLMFFCNSFPKIEGQEHLDKLYKEGRPAMFVANHNSWMDIPFLGHTIGWRNYKIISKQELGKVPILGKAIRVSGNIMVDRKDKRSGLRALKAGIQYLKNGVHLCTFPEGTRSRTGRLQNFKNGAFKMAHKAGAPVVALSIVGAHIAHPVWGMFPLRSARSICKIIIHEPIESEGKTEDELVAEVREKMIEGLSEDQKPLPKK